jgi:hypothetical protein
VAASSALRSDCFPLSQGLWLPETLRTRLICRFTFGGNPARSAGDAQADRMFTTLLSRMLLRARSDATREIEILVLRHQLAVLQGRTARFPDALD